MNIDLFLFHVRSHTYLHKGLHKEKTHTQYLHTDCTECYIQSYIPYIIQFGTRRKSFPMRNRMNILEEYNNRIELSITMN